MANLNRFKANKGLDNNSQTIINVADPVNAQDAATKNFTSNASNLTSGTVSVAQGGTGTGTAFTAGSVVFTGATGVYAQNNAQLFWDSANNRLGVGTASPSYKLDVNGDFRAFSGSGVPLIVQAPSGSRAIINTTDGTYIGRFGSSSSEAYIVAGAQSNHPFLLLTNNTERMRIDSSGKVLIGQTASRGTVSANFQVDDSRISITSSANGIIGGLAPDSSISNSVRIEADPDNVAASSRIVMYVDGTEQVRLDSSGNLGIGTAIPAEKLSVTGNIVMTSTSNVLALSGFTSQYYLQFSSGQTILAGGSTASDGTSIRASGIQTFWTNSSERARIDSSGNVGIGTASPSARLHLYRATSGVQATTPQLTVQSNVADGATADGPGINFANATGAVANIGIGGNGAMYFSNRADSTASWSLRASIPAAGGFRCANSISVGNATPTTSGAGISFPATQSASTDANTLDDYEEGTWTPTVVGGTSAGTAPTYDTQAGFYTKIGNLVTVGITLNLATLGTGTGDVRISGLPFASNSDGSYRASGGLFFFNVTKANAQVVAYMSNNVSYFTIGSRDITTGAASTIQMTEITGDFQVYGTFSYFV